MMSNTKQSTPGKFEETSFNDRDDTKEFSKGMQSFEGSKSFANTKKSHNDTIIKASGKYDIEQALYEFEEYPEDFCSDSGEEEAQ